MKHQLRRMIWAAAAGLTLALSSMAYGQNQEQNQNSSQEKRSQKKSAAKQAVQTPTTDKTTKTDPKTAAPKPDALDLLFEKTEDKIKKGGRCIPQIEREQTPIA